MLTLIKNGLGDGSLSQLFQKRELTVLQRAVETVHAYASDGASVHISPEGRQLQRIGILAEQGDQLRTEKVNRIKTQLFRGEYLVDPMTVAKAVVRSEISRLLSRE